MKILHVITSLRTGGAEQLMVHLLPQLKARRFEVDLCLFDGTNTYFRQQIEAKGIRIIDFGEGNSVYNPMNIIRLRKLIKNYDIIHTHNYSPQIYGVLANIGLGVKMVTTEHNTSNRRRNIAGFKIIDRLMYKRYDAIICISNQAESNLKEYLKFDSPTITIILNGIDIKEFLKSAHSENNKRLLDHEKTNIIMVAAFRPQKDQDTLIKAMTFLPKDFHLNLVGHGPRLAECKELVASLGIADRVTFWGVRNDIPSLLSQSDFIVMSSHYEGLSLSSVEGMCVGKPFIASDVDGLKEVVNGAGILVPHQDAENLAKVILHLSESEDEYSKIATCCKKRALKYDISNMTNGYVGCYKSVF